MRLAAIDIGSNAIRLQISSVLEASGKTIFKKVEYVRFPLRLGKDVFSQGVISESSGDKFIKLMTAVKLLLEIFEVDSYYACATSALRSAANGKELVKRTFKKTGIRIDVIGGEKEASLIDMALTDALPDAYCLHIDVGGGSTELNLYSNRQKIATESFALGSVRNQQEKDKPEDWKALEQWVIKHTKGFRGMIVALGTGGNISKLHSMAGKKQGQNLGIKQILELRNHIAAHSLEERIEHLQLNPDRADVIVPAADIYLRIMRWSHCNGIRVPNIGLKDGLMKYLYQQQRNSPKEQ